MADERDGSRGEPEVVMTIGAVSRATDIPANTLRTWERRYGFPTPARTEGNQRLYAPEVVPQLRLAALALDLGHRPRQVLGLSLAKLQELVGQASPASPAPPAPLTVRPPSPGPRAIPAPLGDVVGGWVQATRDLDGEALEVGFRTEWARLGPLQFLTERAGPFLELVGELWADGELSVFQEHAASQRMREFLTSRWRPLADRAVRSPIVCATLPGEQHDLGLQMAATVAAIASRRVKYLGADTPPAEIAACAVHKGATTVLISVSAGKDPAVTRGDLSTLRSALDPRTEVIVGGGGAPADVPGVVRVTSLPELAERLLRD